MEEERRAAEKVGTDRRAVRRWGEVAGMGKTVGNEVVASGGRALPFVVA